MTNQDALDFPDLTLFEKLAPVGHTGVAGAIIASLAGWLPTVLSIIGGVLGIVWFCICIFESRTFQHWLANYRMKVHSRQLAKLRAQETITIARIAALETLRSARASARELVASAKSDAATLVVKQTSDTASKLPPI